MRAFELPKGLLEISVAIFPEIGKRINAENCIVQQRTEEPKEAITDMRKSVIAANHLAYLSKGNRPDDKERSQDEYDLLRDVALLLHSQFREAKRNSGFWT